MDLALRCGCSVPAVELLDSFAVCIALVAHEADESSPAVRGGDTLFPNDFGGVYVMIITTKDSRSLSCLSILPCVCFIRRRCRVVENDQRRNNCVL